MSNPIIQVESLKKYFDIRGSLLASMLGRPQPKIKGIDGVNFSIKQGEILGLAGESGSGKSTTGMVCVRLYEPTMGRILFQGQDIAPYKGSQLRDFHRQAQMIFQDPYESLNPRFTVFQSIAEPLKVHDFSDRSERENLVNWALESSDLRPPESYLNKFPHQLSGGQRQRVAIARAIVLKPKFLVADEPVSMLDVSIRASLLRLFRKLTLSLQMAGLFISHDLSLIRHICDKTAIMYLGRIVEIGETETVITQPTHPYSRALLAGVSVPDPRIQRDRIILKGEIPSAKNVPPGCRFHTRCEFAEKVCRELDPKLELKANGAEAACHRIS